VRARSSLFALVLVLTALAAAGCGGGSDTPSPPPAHRAAKPSREIVYLRRLDLFAEVYRTLSIRADGRIDVGKFIGEDTGVERYHWRLDAAERARLERLLAAARGRLRATHGPLTKDRTLYILKLRGREIEARAGRVPVRLRPLVAFLDRRVNHPAGRPD
jgi:hypothetical protein